MDLSNNKKLQYVEFLAAAVNREKLLTRENLRLVFNYLTNNQNINVTLINLRNIFIKMDQQTIESFYKVFQIDPFLGFDFEKFVEIMQKIGKQ